MIMPATKRLTILLTDAEYTDLQARAGLVPLSTWIRSEVLGARETGGHEESKDQSLRRDENVPLGKRRTATAAPRGQDSTEKQPSEIDLEVNKRNPGHRMGCECFGCTQTRRFILEMRDKNKVSESPKKRGRRNG